jgi:hypothetical protein
MQNGPGSGSSCFYRVPLLRFSESPASTGVDYPLLLSPEILSILAFRAVTDVTILGDTTTEAAIISRFGSQVVASVASDVAITAGYDLHHSQVFGRKLQSLQFFEEVDDIYATHYAGSRC